MNALQTAGRACRAPPASQKHEGRCKLTAAAQRRPEFSAERFNYGYQGPSLTCTLEYLEASAAPHVNPEQMQRLARSLAACSNTPFAHSLAASLSVASAADDAVVLAYGSCAPPGDVWCLLRAAHQCSQMAAAATEPQLRQQQYAASAALTQRAAAAVLAAAGDWDLWLRGGASAALGSFVVLCSSATRADATRQLAQVLTMVADAAVEEGGLELWALHELLQHQEQRLHLVHSAACCD